MFWLIVYSSVSIVGYFSIPAATITYTESETQSNETGFKTWDLHTATLEFWFSTANLLLLVHSDPVYKLSRKYTVFKMRCSIFIELHDSWSCLKLSIHQQALQTLQYKSGCCNSVPGAGAVWAPGGLTAKHSCAPYLSLRGKGLGCLLFNALVSHSEQLATKTQWQINTSTSRSYFVVEYQVLCQSLAPRVNFWCDKPSTQKANQQLSWPLNKAWEWDPLQILPPQPLLLVLKTLWYSPLSQAYYLVLVVH